MSISAEWKSVLQPHRNAIIQFVRWNFRLWLFHLTKLKARLLWNQNLKQKSADNRVLCFSFSPALHASRYSLVRAHARYTTNAWGMRTEGHFARVLSTATTRMLTRMHMDGMLWHSVGSWMDHGKLNYTLEFAKGEHTFTWHFYCTSVIVHHMHWSIERMHKLGS